MHEVNRTVSLGGQSRVWVADGPNVREIGSKSRVVVVCMEWSSIVDDWFCSHLNSRKTSSVGGAGERSQNEEV